MNNINYNNKQNYNQLPQYDEYDDYDMHYYANHRPNNKIEIWISKKDNYGMLIGVVIAVIIVIFIIIWVSRNVCIKNGVHLKAKNGDCCSLGRTINKKICYNTKCTGPGNERNKYGHCCINGVTHNVHAGPAVNCVNTHCLDGDNYYHAAEEGNYYNADLQICCLYGFTLDGQCNSDACISTVYQSYLAPRTFNGKCCLHGLTTNDNVPGQSRKCNSLKCSENMVNATGKCCKYGPANNKIHCNTVKTKNGKKQNINKCVTHNGYPAFGLSGTCCTNELTANDLKCNSKCKTGGLTNHGVCCPYGATTNKLKCRTKKCNYGFTLSGRCCPSSTPAEDGHHCNIHCNNVNSLHTKKGGCCPPTRKVSTCSIVCNVSSLHTIHGRCCPPDKNVATCSNLYNI